MKNLLPAWPKLVLIGVPICIVIVDGALLLNEYRQPDEFKAIRLVRESTSRKENFTVQQLLYVTVYNRKRNGEQIDIQGWKAERPEGSQRMFVVEFGFRDNKGDHAARWSANPHTGNVLPLNDLARDLSWH